MAQEIQAPLTVAKRERSGARKTASVVPEHGDLVLESWPVEAVSQRCIPGMRQRTGRRGEVGSMSDYCHGFVGSPPVGWRFMKNVRRRLRHDLDGRGSVWRWRCWC